MTERPDPRILVLSDNYLPSVGGSLIWLDNVYRRCPDGTVWIATNAHPDAREFDQSRPGISIHRSKLRSYRFLKPQSLLIYSKLAAMSAWIRWRHRVDIVHVGKVLPEGYIASFLKRRMGIPFIAYAHGEEITVLFQSDAYSHLHETLTRIYNDAEAVIANSEFTRQKLIEIGVEASKIHKITPGVDPTFFRPTEPDPELIRRHGLEGKTIMLSVGRLQKRKGHDFVIEALPLLLKDHPDLAYLILSDGEERQNLERLATKLGVEEHVRFGGEVNYEDLPRYYNTADLFILANRVLDDGDVEGFGIVFLEAAACGTPVIAGDSGGTGEPVREGVNGLRVRSSEPSEIARGISHLLEDPSRRRAMGAAGRRLVEEEYDWDVVCAQVHQLTRDVTSGRSARPACPTR